MSLGVIPVEATEKFPLPGLRGADAGHAGQEVARDRRSSARKVVLSPRAALVRVAWLGNSNLGDPR